MTNNMELWEKVAQPPKWALKTIGAGRLKGKSDINPQWRYQALTEIFGPCGIGWKFTIDKQWVEAGSDGQVMCFANVSLFIFKADCGWSEAIPGTGGSTLIAKEKSGLYSNDEGYKMAVTDALSTACKVLGVAADIYLGRFDGSKYSVPAEPQETPPVDDTWEYTEEHKALLEQLIKDTAADEALFLTFIKAKDLKKLTKEQFSKGHEALLKKSKGGK